MPLFYCLKGGFRAARCSFACGITVAPRKAEALQLGMKPEEIFRLSGFTKDEFLNMMTKGHDTYSKAQVIRSV